MYEIMNYDEKYFLVDADKCYLQNNNWIFLKDNIMIYKISKYNLFWFRFTYEKYPNKELTFEDICELNKEAIIYSGIKYSNINDFKKIK